MTSAGKLFNISQHAFFFLLCLLIPSFIKAQDSIKEPYTVNLKFHYGFVMKHSENMAHLANQHPWGIEADVYRTTIGKKKWQQIHHYPIIGYSFQYFKMDRNKPLGDSYSLIIYYSQRFLKSKRCHFEYRLGLGIGYIERRFNLHSNYKNNLNSTRLNYALNGRLTFSYRICSNFHLTTGIGLMHYSNGAIKTPNLGINLPSGHVGIAWTPFSHSNRISSQDSAFQYSKKIYWNFVGSGGLKQVEPPGKRTYLAYTISTYLSKQVSKRSTLNAGLDLFYDGSNKTIIDTLSVRKNSDFYEIGFVAGSEYLVGKLSLLMQFGIYLYDPLKLEKPVYQRLGLKYQFHKRAFANVNLKIHFGKADIVEWGLGYKIGKL